MDDATLAAADEAVEPDEAEELPSEESEPAEIADESPAEAEASDEGEPAEEPAPEEEPSEPAQPAPEEAEPEPFQFRVDGREHQAGRRRTDGSVEFSADEWARRIQPMLSDQATRVERERTYRQQIAELTERADPDRNPDVLKARQALNGIRELIQASDDEFLEKAWQWKQQWPLLEAQAEIQALRQQNTAVQQTARQRADQESLQAQMPVWQEGLRQATLQLLDAEYAGIDLDRDVLVEDVMADLDRVLFRAQQDMPEYGLRQGDIGVNYDLIRRRAKLAAAQLQRVQQKTATVERVEKKNREALKPSKKAPPTVSAKGSPPVGEEQRKFKDGAEFKEYMRGKYGVPIQ